MRLPPKVREQFRRYGRKGGLRRAERLKPELRAAVARSGATARWIQHRFGAPSFTALGLPGGELVDMGLADLGGSKVTVASLLVSLAAPRLRREGVPVGSVHVNPEERLYDLLSQQKGDLAHARYGAYLKQMSAFADACYRARLSRTQRAP